jgi:hypothetical protein
MAPSISIANPEKFRNLKEGFREFKSFQIRMPCRFLPQGLVLITHVVPLSVPGERPFLSTA